MYTHVYADLSRAAVSRKMMRSNPVTRRPEHRRKSGLKDAEEETSLNKDHACGSAGVALRRACALRKLRRASAATSLVELC